MSSLAEKNDKLVRWLKTHGADEYAQAFQEQGYQDLTDVDDDAINQIVKKKGVAGRLKRSLRKPAGPSSMSPPSLPVGTPIDLSAPDPESPDGITFQIPGTLSVGQVKDAIQSPASLTPEDWMTIARNSALLYGFQMGETTPTRAEVPVLHWMVPKSSDFMMAAFLEGGAESKVTYTAESANYVRQGFDSETASAGFPFCAASFERSHKEKTSHSSMEKHLFMLGLWRYPRAVLHLDRCTTVNPCFEKQIKAALTSSHPAEELDKVFTVFGHAVPSSVTLGGQLVFQNDEDIHSSVSEKQVEDCYKAAVQAKYAGAEASSGFAYQSASGEKITAQDIAKSSSFHAVGGDATQASNPASWAPSVPDPHLWAVIENTKVRHTLELLDNGLQRKVLDVWAGVPPALDAPEELFWREDEGAVFKAADCGFLSAVRQSGEAPTSSDQSCGAVLLTSGPGSCPTEGDPGTAAGGAYVDNWGGLNTCNSVCMPVRSGAYFGRMFRHAYFDPSERKVPWGRVSFTKCKLRLGDWLPAFGDASVVSTRGERTADRDGFLFVSIVDPQRPIHTVVVGGVIGMMDGVNVTGSYIAGASAYLNCVETFCVPVPRGTKYAVYPSFGDIAPPVQPVSPVSRAYWMPIADDRWKLNKAEPRSVNTLMVAETDGFLHGWVRGKNNGDRGTLRLYTGAAALQAASDVLPDVGASVDWTGVQRPIQWNSVLMAVPKGAQYKALLTPKAGSPEADLFWTAIVPA